MREKTVSDPIVLIRHDLAYWKGGTEQQRLEADQALQQCVAQTGEPKIAQLMLAGVRVGGSPVSVMNYRWGYGWPLLRGYKALTPEESKEVQQQLARFKVMVKSLYQELGLGGGGRKNRVRGHHSLILSL